MVTDKPTMNVREAAALLGISVPNMYTLTERSDFDALIQIGRRKIIHKEKFLAWMERQTERT